MAERWVSQGRYFCKVCRCWLSKHSACIAAHEASAGHVAKEQKQLKELYKKEADAQRGKQVIAAELARIDAASRLTEETRVKMQLASESLHRAKKARAESEIEELIKLYSVTPPRPLEISHSVSPNQQWLALKDPTTDQPMWINANTGEKTTVNPLVSSANQPLQQQSLELSLARNAGELVAKYREQVLKKYGLLTDGNEDASEHTSPETDLEFAWLNGDEIDQPVAQQDLALLSQIKSGLETESPHATGMLAAAPDAVGERIAELFNAKPQVFGPWEAVPVACEKTGKLLSEEDLFRQEEQQRKERELEGRLAAEKQSMAAANGVKNSSDISLAALKEGLASRLFLSNDDLQLVDEDG